jgi:hypothetical protein
MSLERLAARLVPKQTESRRLAQVKRWDAATAGPPALPARIDLFLPGITNDDGSAFVLVGVPYMATYAPSAGDWVWVDTSRPDWFVIGKRA